MEIISKTPRTDKDVDNSVYELKVPYQVKDDFGNEVTMYRREERLCTEYDLDINRQITTLEQEITRLRDFNVKAEIAKCEAKIEELNLKKEFKDASE